MKTIFTLLMFVMTLSVNAQQQQPSLVTVVGEGTVNVVPDQVVLKGRVEHEGQDPSQIKIDNDKVVAAIFSFLKKDPNSLQQVYF